MFAIIAALIFILAAFNVTMGTVNLVALGLCALAIHFFNISWPQSFLPFKRKN